MELLRWLGRGNLAILRTNSMYDNIKGRIHVVSPEWRLQGGVQPHAERTAIK